MLWRRIDRTCRSVLTLNRDREFRTLTSMLELRRTDVVLDVGSGDGFWTQRLAKACAMVVGLEPWTSGLHYAQRLHSRPNIMWVRGLAERLPFPDETFDKVISVSCLEHFADPHQGLKEMYRVLKPGGRLALSVDTLLPENSPASFREWHKKRHFVTHYFCQDELAGIMDSLGAKCEPNRTVHLFRSRASRYIRQLFIRHPRLFLPVFPLFYVAVRASDGISDHRHGQIIVMTATR